MPRAIAVHGSLRLEIQKRLILEATAEERNLQGFENTYYTMLFIVQV